MKFHQTKIPAVVEIELEPNCDERGFLARSWCQREFEQAGLNPKTAQCSISFNERKGTLRGIHYQAEPYPEVKVVRCTSGALYDVVVDLRPHSPTYKQWTGVVLSAANRLMLYVPEGCGHGYLTLQDGTEVFYQISEFYRPELARGVRWDDPAFQIQWPITVERISERDRTFPNFE